MSGKDEPTRESLKQAVCEAIDRHGNEIIELGEQILHHPETEDGFMSRMNKHMDAYEAGKEFPPNRSSQRTPACCLR